MNQKKLIWIVSIWIILTLSNYYYVPYFLNTIEWLILSLALLIWTVVHITKLIKERKNLNRHRISSFLVISTLFLLTLFRQPVNQIIEKIDWLIFFRKRSEVVEQVKNGKLKPNVSWNNWVCELPYEFPVISNGGNDIAISQNLDNGSFTINFWVFRNFFDSPSTKFIYTNNPDRITQLEKRISEKPKQNWKLEENWYRIYGNY